MTKLRWQHLKSVLSAAIELDRSAAEQHLETACAGDRELFAEAVRLLDLHYQSGLYLDQSVFDWSLLEWTEAEAERLEREAILLTPDPP